MCADTEPNSPEALDPSDKNVKTLLMDDKIVNKFVDYGRYQELPCNKAQAKLSKLAHSKTQPWSPVACYRLCWAKLASPRVSARRISASSRIGWVYEKSLAIDRVDGYLARV